MDNNALFAKMVTLAAIKHENQVDKSGKSYILHVLHVMETVESDDIEVKMIAVGHDLIEDTDITENDLKLMGFSDRVVSGIVSLTKIRGESYDSYKNRVKSNKDAILVKMADLRHNMQLSRLKHITNKDIIRVRKYIKFLGELENIVLTD